MAVTNTNKNKLITLENLQQATTKIWNKVIGNESKIKLNEDVLFSKYIGLEIPQKPYKYELIELFSFNTIVRPLALKIFLHNETWETYMPIYEIDLVYGIPGTDYTLDCKVTPNTSSDNTDFLAGGFCSYSYEDGMIHFYVVFNQSVSSAEPTHTRTFRYLTIKSNDNNILNYSPLINTTPKLLGEYTGDFVPFMKNGKSFKTDVMARSFKKINGTSEQLLCADGSVANKGDFAKASHTHDYLPKGNTTNIQLNDGTTTPQSTFAKASHTHDYLTKGTTKDIQLNDGTTIAQSTFAKASHTHNYLPKGSTTNIQLENGTTIKQDDFVKRSQGVVTTALTRTSMTNNPNQALSVANGICTANIGGTEVLGIVFGALDTGVGLQLHLRLSDNNTYKVSDYIISYRNQDGTLIGGAKLIGDNLGFEVLACRVSSLQGNHGLPPYAIAIMHGSATYKVTASILSVGGETADLGGSKNVADMFTIMKFGTMQRGMFSNNKTIPIEHLGQRGLQGEKGADGFTWRPSVDSVGNLTWTKNASTTTPTPMNIKGEKGDKGANGTDGVTPNITASAELVNDTTSTTSSVEVTKSGTTTAPSFKFSFKNLFKNFVKLATIDDVNALINKLGSNDDTIDFNSRILVETKNSSGTYERVVTHSYVEKCLVPTFESYYPNKTKEPFGMRRIYFFKNNDGSVNYNGYVNDTTSSIQKNSWYEIGFSRRGYNTWGYTLIWDNISIMYINGEYIIRNNNPDNSFRIATDDTNTKLYICPIIASEFYTAKLYISHTEESNSNDLKFMLYIGEVKTPIYNETILDINNKSVILSHVKDVDNISSLDSSLAVTNNNLRNVTNRTTTLEKKLPFSQGICKRVYLRYYKSDNSSFAVFTGYILVDVSGAVTLRGRIDGACIGPNYQPRGLHQTNAVINSINHTFFGSSIIVSGSNSPVEGETLYHGSITSGAVWNYLHNTNMPVVEIKGFQAI